MKCFMNGRGGHRHFSSLAFPFSSRHGRKLSLGLAGKLIFFFFNLGVAGARAAGG